MVLCTLALENTHFTCLGPLHLGLSFFSPHKLITFHLSILLYCLPEHSGPRLSFHFSQKKVPLPTPSRSFKHPQCARCCGGMGHWDGGGGLASCSQGPQPIQSLRPLTASDGLAGPVQGGWETSGRRPSPDRALCGCISHLPLPPLPPSLPPQKAFLPLV